MANELNLAVEDPAGLQRRPQMGENEHTVIVPPRGDHSSSSSSSSTANNNSHPSSSPSLSPWQDRLILLLLTVANFIIAFGVSLQGPFFPKEAESKGAQPITYSSIFAIYELVMLVTSFAFGKLAGDASELMSGAGLTLTGLSTALFGLLTLLPGQLPFVGAAFALRIVESLGATAFATSSYSFIAACHPQKTGTMFATLETAFGGGVVIGPVVGGFLYDLGGFLLPFLTVGAMMTTGGVIILSGPVQRLFRRGKEAGQRKAAEIGEEGGGVEAGNSVQSSSVDSRKLLAAVSETDHSINNDEEGEEESLPTTTEVPLPTESSITLWRFLASPAILLDALIIISALNLMGFNGATLEVFLRGGGIVSSTLAVSLLFAALGAAYGVGALLCGKACDRLPPKYLLLFSIAGSALTAVGLIFLGPLPFLEHSLAPSLLSAVLCLLLFGTGSALKQVAAYTHALKYTIHRRRFPDNQTTYGFISGMFFACLSLGGFIGPIIGGSLVQASTFQTATLVMWVIELVVLLTLLTLHFCCPSFRL